MFEKDNEYNITSVQYWCDIILGQGSAGHFKNFVSTI